ncbi:unnamed protein product [Boreogadus saida]
MRGSEGVAWGTRTMRGPLASVEMTDEFVADRKLVNGADHGELAIKGTHLQTLLHDPDGSLAPDVVVLRRPYGRSGTVEMTRVASPNVFLM